MVEGEGCGWSSVLPQLLHGQQILYISLVELVEGRGGDVHVEKDSLMPATG